jgi:glycosyltransferase involved in cell wall biosynthesis
VSTVKKKSIKVIQLVPELNSGGVERGTLELGKFLSENNHESIVISNGGAMVPRLKSEGSRHIQMPVHKKSLLSLIQVPRIRKLFTEEKPDIVHARSRVPAWISYLALKSLALKVKPKFVTTVHGFYSVNFYSEVMIRGDQVICVSNSSKDYARKNYSTFDEKNTTVIHRGVDANFFNQDFRPAKDWIQNWEADHTCFKGKFLVLLPGRITRWKGQLDFIKVISALRKKGYPVHGLLVGDAHPKKNKFKKEVLNSIQASGYSTDFTFLGNRSDLREIMSVSDAVVSCSTDPEAFGRVSLEALSLGIPVAGYAHGGVKEQLEALCPSGMVNVGDTEAMCSKLALWINKVPVISKNEKFTLPSALEKTLSVYSQELISV